MSARNHRDNHANREGSGPSRRLLLIESRSFHLTAERLGLSQSTVSSRVKTLEAELGSVLFQRGRSGVLQELAAAGKYSG